MKKSFILQILTKRWCRELSVCFKKVPMTVKSLLVSCLWCWQSWPACWNLLISFWSIFQKSTEVSGIRFQRSNSRDIYSSVLLVDQRLTIFYQLSNAILTSDEECALIRPLSDPRQALLVSRRVAEWHALGWHVRDGRFTRTPNIQNPKIHMTVRFYDFLPRPNRQLIYVINK